MVQDFFPSLGLRDSVGTGIWLENWDGTAGKDNWRDRKARGRVQEKMETAEYFGRGDTS